MKRFLSILAVLFLALPAAAATDMLTAAGTDAAPVSSSCPASALGVCSSGWFSIKDAAYAVIHVWESAGTATVVLEQRLDSTDGAWVLKTWTNPTLTEVAVVVDPAAGEVRITVSAIGGGGVVKAKISAVSPAGAKLW